MDRTGAPACAPRRGLSRRGIPAVREAEDVLVIGHDVDGQPVDGPPAERRLVSVVFLESERPKPPCERVVLGSRADGGDDIDVVGRARGRCSRIGDEKTADHSSDEGDLLAQPAEAHRHRPKRSKLGGGGGHPRRLRSSFTASSRSRARPPRTASTRASSSYRLGSARAAFGTER